jgi:hypothetical protein
VGQTLNRTRIDTRPTHFFAQLFQLLAPISSHVPRETACHEITEVGALQGANYCLETGEPIRLTNTSGFIMGFVSRNTTVFLPCAARSDATGVLATVLCAFGTTSVSCQGILNSGSSQHGQETRGLKSRLAQILLQRSSLRAPILFKPAHTRCTRLSARATPWRDTTNQTAPTGACINVGSCRRA